jgi:hypothetical protein
MCTVSASKAKVILINKGYGRNYKYQKRAHLLNIGVSMIFRQRAGTGQRKNYLESSTNIIGGNLED